LIPQTTAAALKARLGGVSGAQHGVPFLLDVREPWEFEYCRIDGSMLIPLGQLPQRASELPADREIVVICHHGNRSMHAAGFLQQRYGLNVTNLQGGVAAWARDVDPAMRQY
jgi:rhodanese-related sulfurtransferase